VFSLTRLQRAIRMIQTIDLVVNYLLPPGAPVPSRKERNAIKLVLLLIIRRGDLATVESSLTDLRDLMVKNNWIFMVTSIMYFATGTVPPDQQRPYRDGCDDICRRLFNVDFEVNGSVGCLLIGGRLNGSLSSQNYSFLSTALYSDELPKVSQRRADAWLRDIKPIVK
jgi:hypothetical protein